MAVFTPLSDAQVAAFLEKFDVGSLVSLQGVAGGTENSTFFVTTERREMVLTLFEQGEHEELPFFVELLDYLDEHGLPVPGTIHDREGVALHSLAGKPALLFPRLPGKHPTAPNLAQCQALGSALGRMHKVSQHFPGHRPNPRNLHWLRAVHHKVLTYISPDDQTLMKNEVDDFETAFSQYGALPQGALHGDLFRDNTLYEGDQLGGIIDFYNGCTGDLLFDLAIVINDWASNEDGSLNASGKRVVGIGKIGKREGHFRSPFQGFRNRVLTQPAGREKPSDHGNAKAVASGGTTHQPGRGSAVPALGCGAFPHPTHGILVALRVHQ